MTLCECGCGQDAKPGNRFILGHNARSNNPMANPASLKKLLTTLKNKKNTTPMCRVCGDVLNDNNWTIGHSRRNNRICKKCKTKQAMVRRRNMGQRPMNDNKECTVYLGVYVAERVLSKVFKDVQIMPYGNPGYDIICNMGKLIDIKSCATGYKGRWEFCIERNGIPDYFLCLAFGDRENLVPEHMWMIPGNVINHLKSATISKSTVDRWAQYEMPIDKVITCCNVLKGDHNE